MSSYTPGSPKKKARFDSTSLRDGANVLGAGACALMLASADLPFSSVAIERKGERKGVLTGGVVRLIFLKR